MNLDDRRDVISDPLLATAMAELRQEAPAPVDWEGLRRSINERAALPLARRRAQRTSFIARRLAPMAIAAGVAFALWVGPAVYNAVLGPEAANQYSAAIDSDDILVHALGSDLTEQEFRLLVTGRANPEVLLAVAIGTR